MSVQTVLCPMSVCSVANVYTASNVPPLDSRRIAWYSCYVDLVAALRPSWAHCWRLLKEQPPMVVLGRRPRFFPKFFHDFRAAASVSIRNYLKEHPQEKSGKKERRWKKS
jgi:hypothetical protein